MARTMEKEPSFDIRPGEVAIDLPGSTDAAVYFIGQLRTPWRSRAECPKRGDPDNGPLCTVEIAPHWQDALAGIGRHEKLQLLYWMHLARRDLVAQYGDVRVTLSDSFAAGNCFRGSGGWLAKWFPGNESPTIAEICAIPSNLMDPRAFEACCWAAAVWQHKKDGLWPTS